MRYNDHVLDKMIQLVRETNSSSYLLYLSDHAEDVYRTRNLAYHADAEATKPMYDIPFILWRSSHYHARQSDSLIIDASRKYMIDDLIHSIADLSGVQFNQFEAHRSIFNKAFRPQTRKVSKGIDYEMLAE